MCWGSLGHGGRSIPGAPGPALQGFPVIPVCFAAKISSHACASANNGSWGTPSYPDSPASAQPTEPRTCETGPAPGQRFRAGPGSRPGSDLSPPCLGPWSAGSPPQLHAQPGLGRWRVCSSGTTGHTDTHTYRDAHGETYKTCGHTQTQGQRHVHTQTHVRGHRHTHTCRQRHTHADTDTQMCAYTPTPTMRTRSPE